MDSKTSSVHLLILVRHAKSSWDYPKIEDRYRPLAARGLRQVSVMVQMLMKYTLDDTTWITSPALRALHTATLFTAHLQTSHLLQVDESMYHGSSKVIWEITKNCQTQSLVIFGHNPAIEAFLREYSDFHYEKFPTCAIAILQKNEIKNENIREKPFFCKELWFPKSISPEL